MSRTRPAGPALAGFARDSAIRDRSRDYALVNFQRRVALVNAPGIQCLGRNRACGQDSMCAHGDPGANPAMRAKPYPVVQNNRLHNEVERREFVVMTPGTQECALRNTDVAPDLNFSQVE